MKGQGKLRHHVAGVITPRTNNEFMIVRFKTFIRDCFLCSVSYLGSSAGRFSSVAVYDNHNLTKTKTKLMTSIRKTAKTSKAQTIDGSDFCPESHGTHLSPTGKGRSLSFLGRRNARSD